MEIASGSGATWAAGISCTAAACKVSGENSSATHGAMLEKVSNAYAKIIVFIISVYETLFSRQYFVIITKYVQFFNIYVLFADRRHTSRFGLTALSTRLSLVCKASQHVCLCLQTLQLWPVPIFISAYSCRPAYESPAAPKCQPAGSHMEAGGLSFGGRYQLPFFHRQRAGLPAMEIQPSVFCILKATASAGQHHTVGTIPKGLPTKQLTSCRSAMGKAADEQRWPHCRSENCGSHSARPRGASLRDK